jgi:transcriptional regulator of heat shock response
VINKDDVHNKVIHVDRDYSELELQQAAQTLSHYLIGRSFESARQITANWNCSRRRRR